MDRSRISNREEYLYQRTKQQALGQKIVHFGEPSNVNYILRARSSNKDATTIELAWTDTREYSTLENNLDSRRGQRIRELSCPS